MIITMFVTTTLSFSLLAANHSNQHEDPNHDEKPYFKIFAPVESSHSQISKFPETPKIVSPEALSKVPQGHEVLLKWQEIPGATSYHLQIASYPQFKWIIQEVYSLTETEFRVRDLTPGTVFWRVAAVNSQNAPGYTKSPFASSSFELIHR